MFERIKCYKSIKKMNKVAVGFRKIGEINNDEELIREANEVLYMNEILKKKMIFNRKIAKTYNLEMIRMGFN